MINREEFLLKSIEGIEKEGWSERAFEMPIFKLLFPDGLIQAAQIYFDWTMRETFVALHQKEIDDLKTFAKVRLAMMTRFEVLWPHQKIEKALFYYLRKQPRGVKFLYKIVDEIWYWAGDKSLDYNFYTKRALLAGVYTSCFREFMDDDASLEKTAQKIDLRLSQVGQIPKIKEKIKAWLRC